MALEIERQLLKRLTFSFLPITQVNQNWRLQVRMDERDNMPNTPSKLPQPTKVKTEFAPIMRSANPIDERQSIVNPLKTSTSDPKRRRAGKLVDQTTLHRQRSVNAQQSFETEWVKKSVGNLEVKRNQGLKIDLSLQNQSNLENSVVKEQNIHLLDENAQLKDNNKQLLFEIERLNHQLSNSIQNSKETDHLVARKVELEQELSELNRNLRDERLKYEGKIGELELALKKTSSESFVFSANLAAVSLELSNVKSELEKKIQENQMLNNQNLTMSNDIQDLEAKLREAESIRRSLFNTIQELKGNIRVFCRLKPTMENSCISISNSDSNSLEIVQQSENNGRPRVSNFTFDRVFSPQATQQAIWEEVSQLIQSALDGYRVCIFAYGQTGSGKTFTMEGNIHDEVNCGIIPRSVQKIFQDIRTLSSLGWNYTMEVSFLEIYNDTIRDLLCTKESSLRYEIKHESNSTHVTNLIVEQVSNEQEVMSLLNRASRNRSVGETQCNERSSRSHSVFTAKLKGTNSKTGQSCDGLLNLIDLAGSERLDQSGATGDRKKETCAINKR